MPVQLQRVPEKYLSAAFKQALHRDIQRAVELCKIKAANPIVVKCEVIDEVLTITTERHTIEQILSLEIAGAKKGILKVQPEVITEKVEKSCMVLTAVGFGTGLVAGLGICVLAK